MPRPLPALALLLLLTSGVMAQQLATPSALLPNGDENERAARIALTGDLGLPALQPVRSDSPRTSLYFADRVHITPQQFAASSGTPPTMFDGFIPSGSGGTETIFPEVFKYQLGNSYSGTGTAHPLVVAYHGFGSSAGSVANQSTIDEEADSRGWVYVAPTGLDDQLFGSPICQQHIEVVIQYMLDNFNVDPDRIYMVGFSMGGGVAASFASRHRDPDGLMISAVGMVSSTMDWAMEYDQGNSGVQTLLENTYNFGGPPSTELFRYQQASGLYFDPTTYPPLPGTLDDDYSMGTNLAPLPTYVTYDTGDSISYVPDLNDELTTMLTGMGASVTSISVTGTVDGDGNPAPHSWAVLDESDLFDFFDGEEVDRTPSDIEAQQDLGGPVAFLETTQETADEFTWIDATSDRLTATLTVSNVENASVVEVDVSETGINSMPVRVTASAAAGESYQLRLTGFSSSPSYMTDHTSGALITLVDSEPSTGTLIYEVEAGVTLDADVNHDADWTASFTTSPNPVTIGSSTQVDIDGPSSATGAWIIVSITEMLTPVKGVTVTALPIPPALIVFVPLDAQGDSSFSAAIPNDPLLQGYRLPTQAVLTSPPASPEAVTNLWGFRIE
jgi:pimeloyl-ACP methyl ester carboxylesterase